MVVDKTEARSQDEFTAGKSDERRTQDSKPGVFVDIFREVEQPTLEAMIVYLADKYVRDEEPVSVEERYSRAEIKYGSIPGEYDKIQRYKRDALKVKELLTNILGFSPDKIVFD